MKISKSFKIYIHILLVFLISKNVLADTDFSKNIVIYEKPKIIEELKFKDLNLQDVDLTNKKGNIMILNFWATWCAPCKKEMPSLNNLAKKFKKEKLEIVTIASGRNSISHIEDFFLKNEIDELPKYRDPSGKTAISYKVIGLPTTIIVNSRGNGIWSRNCSHIKHYNAIINWRCPCDSFNEKKKIW